MSGEDMISDPRATSPILQRTHGTTTTVNTNRYIFTQNQVPKIVFQFKLIQLERTPDKANKSPRPLVYVLTRFYRIKQ